MVVLCRRNGRVSKDNDFLDGRLKQSRRTGGQTAQGVRAVLDDEVREGTRSPEGQGKILVFF